jgi:DNA-binding phage protein
MNAPRDVSYDDYLNTSLTDPSEAAAYLNAAIELEDTPALLLALRQVAKAHGMALEGREAADA